MALGERECGEGLTYRLYLDVLQGLLSDICLCRVGKYISIGCDRRQYLPVPELIDAALPYDSQQPGAHGAATQLVATGIEPKGEEAFLNSILRAFPIAKHAVRNGESKNAMAIVEGTKSVRSAAGTGQQQVGVRRIETRQGVLPQG